MNAEARELEVFIENDGTLYRQRGLPIIRNLVLKMVQGKYDSTKAVKLYMYLVDDGAKKYAKESGGADWSRMFPKATRETVAKSLVKGFEDEAKLGNYDSHIPKKYKHLSLRKR